MANGRLIFVAYAVGLSVIGLFASDMYLPAFGQIAAHFNASKGVLGLSVTVFMIGFTIAQLLYGALSDQVGRRLPLIAGLVLFIAGSVGCIFSGDVPQFLICRLMQSLGIAAAYILWQPMIIDSFQDKSDVQKVFSTIMAMGALSPALAPLTGGYLASNFGWKSVFVFLILAAALILSHTLFSYRETLSPASRRRFSLRSVIGSYANLLKNRIFFSISLAISCAVSLYIVYLVAIPLILDGLAYRPDQIGLMYVPIALTFTLGALTAKKIYPALGDVHTMNVGVALVISGVVAVVAVILNVKLTAAWQLITPFTIITFGNGFFAPTGQAFLMQTFKSSSGSCASSMGFMLTGTATAATLSLSLLFNTVGIYSVVIVFCAIAVTLVASYGIGVVCCRTDTEMMAS